MKKSHFERMEIIPVKIRLQSTLLTGSVTDHTIKIKDDGVSVKEFTFDSDFESSGEALITF